MGTRRPYRYEHDRRSHSPTRGGPLNSPHPETVCVEAGGNHTPASRSAPALHLSTTYHHGGDYEYIREASPTIEAFERVVGSLEGGHAVAFSSGMAASAAVLDGLAPGARVLAPTVSYKGVRKLLAERASLGALEVSLTRPDRDRGGDRGDRRRGPGLGRDAEQPAGRDHRPRRRSPPPPTSAAPESRSTRRLPPRCCSAPSSSAPTSSSTRRPSTSPGTPTRCWGSSSPPTRPPPGA